MSKFSKQYPDFAAVERHVRRAQAERAVAIGTWIAGALVGLARGTRGLFTRPAPARRGGRLVARASLGR